MSGNKVLAAVNGKEITQQDVYTFLRGLDPQVATQFQSPEGVRKLINELVNQEVMYLDAVENAFDQEENFKSELERVKVNVLKQYAISKLLSGISATDEEITKYYNDHKEQFQKPESVKASHILVDEIEKAQKIRNEINEGLSFEEAAGKYSTCPSKQAGGDLGEFEKGKMVPEFEEVAFNMEEGKLSEPVKTQFGYHLIKVQYRKAANMRTLEEVKEQVTQRVVALKQQESYLRKTEELKNKYEVSINI